MFIYLFLLHLKIENCNFHDNTFLNPLGLLSVFCFHLTNLQITRLIRKMVRVQFAFFHLFHFFFRFTYEPLFSKPSCINSHRKRCVQLVNCIVVKQISFKETQWRKDHRREKGEIHIGRALCNFNSHLWSRLIATREG